MDEIGSYDKSRVAQWHWKPALDQVGLVESHEYLDNGPELTRARKGLDGQPVLFQDECKRISLRLADGIFYISLIP
jgi:hypothetical protein